MIGFQKQWCDLAFELKECAAACASEVWPIAHGSYDSALIPPPTDTCKFDGMAALLAEAGLCSKFGQSDHGVAVAPFTSHYDLCISRFGSFPAFYDNEYLRISPYWNDAFVVTYVPYRNDRSMGGVVDEYVYARKQELLAVVVSWLPRLS